MTIGNSVSHIMYYIIHEYKFIDPSQNVFCNQVDMELFLSAVVRVT